jgi:hypothetical protein
MGIHKSMLDNAQADDDSRITACEADIVTLQGQVASLQSDLATALSAISALQAANSGDQSATAPTITSTDIAYADATGVSILGIGVATLAEFNDRLGEVRDDFNAMRSEVVDLVDNLQAASPAPLLV